MTRVQRFTQAEAVALAEKYYGLLVTAHPLPGFCDDNFHLKSQDGEYVLKICREGGPEDFDFQHRAMTHLAERMEPGMFPQPLKSLAGETIFALEQGSGPPVYLRLLSWVTGTPLAVIDAHPPDLLTALGRFLGDMSTAFEGFSHTAMFRPMSWDLRNTGMLRENLSTVEEATHRDLVLHFLKRFEDHVLPVANHLRTRVGHHDANDYNFLVQPDERGGFQPAGLIDFGDMVHSWLVNEIAVAAAYLTLRKEDPISAVASLVTGFHARCPLSETEISLIYDLLCLRLCFSGVMCAYQQSLDPENAYLNVTTDHSWTTLATLRAFPAEKAHFRFRLACGLEPVPSRDNLVSWLQRQPGFCAVMEMSEKPIVFDFTAGSPDTGGTTDFDDVVQATDYLFDRMREAETTVGIGRYNEDRVIYKSDVFRPAEKDGQWRTTHLGIDLFAAPETGVRAPLDGTVHSFKDNANDLDYGPTIILQHTYDDGHFFSLYGHLSRESLVDLYIGKPIAAGSVFARLGDHTVNGGWAPHLHFQVMSHMLDAEGDFPGVASRNELPFYLSLCPDPNLVLRLPELLPPQQDKARLLALRRQHLGPSLSLAYRDPLHIVRGQGQYLYDADGRQYLDLVNNVCHVGHCHPRVVAAIQEQVGRLNTNTRYLHENLVTYGTRLCATLPEPLRVCFLVCSGSEANDLALRLARTYTGRRDVVVIDGAYHGNTNACIDLSPYKFNGRGGKGVPVHVRIAATPDPYRGSHGADDPGAGEHYAADVARAVAQCAEPGPAAFFAEPILGCAGQIEAPVGYLQEAFAHVRRAGGLCIADEVQVGFGRIGTHFWAFQSQGVVPDIVTLGKPIGNGHPLAAVVTTAEIAAAFNNGMEYFNTFGGNPVSCAAGLAVLNVLQDEALQQHALDMGTHLSQGLRALQSKHKVIGDIRGRGLFQGIELVSNRETKDPAPQTATRVIEELVARGILLSVDGPHYNVLKIKPPLVISQTDIERFLDELDKVLLRTPLV